MNLFEKKTYIRTLNIDYRSLLHRHYHHGTTSVVAAIAIAFAFAVAFAAAATAAADRQHDATSVVATTRHGRLLFVVCCCLHPPLQLSSPTRHPPVLLPSMQPPLPVQSLPLRQPSPSGQEAPAEDGGSGHHGQVLFGREVKKVYFSPHFT